MSTPKTTTQFTALLTESKTNPDSLGFFLGGSRGKGFENSHSDYDVHLIIKDEVAKKYQNKYQKIKIFLEKMTQEVILK